ncbi:hypothetical protein SPFL3102_00705 [Sporomusaceae bacterium FL31]|nr:hypothetical protein SPFL3101_00547 [Sporomusaceae bacterium FL31]GCE32904.1 hypothetical protein SPFL3102_00705 [Sporomusaceae bacterium]
MKKRLLAAAIAASMTLSLGVAMAAPVEFDGSVETHYQWDQADGLPDVEGARNTIIVNAKTALDENVDVYARFAAQRYHGDSGSADFDTSKGKSTATIDRYGFIIKSDAGTYTLGRQGGTIGANALLYSTDGNIGSYDALDAVSGVVTTGVTELQFLAGQETGGDNKLYSLHASYQPATDWTLGATLAKYDNKDGDYDSSKHWAIDTSYAHGATTYFAEYAKSDADNDNKAFVVGVSHDLDDKNSISLSYAKVEVNGSIAEKTDFDSGLKGLYFGYDHKLTENTTFSVAYNDLKQIGGSDKSNSLETFVTYSF